MDTNATLLAATGFDIAIAIAYTLAGASILRRSAGSSMRRASRMFSLWWFGIGATATLSAARGVLALQGASPQTIDALDQVGLAAYAAALVGFVSYLGSIYLGRHALDAGLAIGYGALVAWSAIAASAQPATGYHVAAWRPVVERPAGGFGPPELLTALLLVAPVWIATLAYARLRSRVEDAATRRRATLVTVALVAWNVGVLAIALPAWSEAALAQAVGRALVLASAAGIFVAYQPPREGRALDEIDAALQAAERAARLESRVRQLV